MGFMRVSRFHACTHDSVIKGNQASGLMRWKQVSAVMSASECIPCHELMSHVTNSSCICLGLLHSTGAKKA